MRLGPAAALLVVLSLLLPLHGVETRVQFDYPSVSVEESHFVSNSKPAGGPTSGSKSPNSIGVSPIKGANKNSGFEGSGYATPSTLLDHAEDNYTLQVTRDNNNNKFQIFYPYTIVATRTSIFKFSILRCM